MLMHGLSARLKVSLLRAMSLLLAICVAERGVSRFVTDATGRKVEIADTRRVVSIGGSITEILYALGLQKNIVAVDTTSHYPPAALKEKPNVGYMRQLSAEGVLALSPTLVLALQGSGPKETIDVSEQSKVPFVVVPDKFSGEGILEKIRIIAQSMPIAATSRFDAPHNYIVTQSPVSAGEQPGCTVIPSRFAHLSINRCCHITTESHSMNDDSNNSSVCHDKPDSGAFSIVLRAVARRRIDRTSTSRRRS
jgi:Periplasmic binding protein